MHEQQPADHEPGETEPGPGNGPWDPAEQVGDIYQVETEDDGTIASVERLVPRPSVWIGSWLDYNNGILHGQWIDAAREEADVWHDIQAVLASSPTAANTGETAEDWGIFDFENFGPLRIHEQDSVAWVTAVARGIAEHGPAFAAYADVMQDEEPLAGFADDYLGRYDSVQAYAEQMVDDLGYEQLLDQALPDGLRHYVAIDTAGLARDLQYGGDIHVLPAEDGGVWIFTAR